MTKRDIDLLANSIFKQIWQSGFGETYEEAEYTTVGILTRNLEPLLGGELFTKTEDNNNVTKP